MDEKTIERLEDMLMEILLNTAYGLVQTAESRKRRKEFIRELIKACGGGYSRPGAEDTGGWGTG